MMMKLKSIAKVLGRNLSSSPGTAPTAKKLSGGSVAKVPETSSFPAILAVSAFGGYMAYIVSDYVTSKIHHRSLMRHVQERQHLRKALGESKEMLDKKREKVLAKRMETW